MIETIEGVFKPSPKGFGFIIDKKTNNKVLVPFKTLKSVPLFLGDVVEMSYTLREDGKINPLDIKVIDTSKRTIIGTIEKGNFIAENPLIPDIAVRNNIPADGSIVKSTVIFDNGWTLSNTKVLGGVHDNRIERKTAISEYEIPTTHLSLDTDYISNLTKKADTKTRKDYTSLDFVTIDGESTKDVDDAIYVEKLKNGSYLLRVAIADVAQYIPENTELDKSAFEKGTSVYFIQGAVHMLPSELSENALSLLPQQKRAALVATMEINASGEILNTTLEEAWIESKRKFTYTEVTDLLTTKLEDDSISQNIYKLEELYEILLDARIRRHSIPIRSAQIEYDLDELGKISWIMKKPWHIAYGLVEEAMLVTNTAVGNWMVSKQLNGLYRYHSGPSTEKWELRKNFYESIGLEIDDSPSLQQIANILDIAKDTELESIVKQTIKTSMSPATYEMENTSHFSLGYDWYTHFTSPIRRYADLTIHRIIKRYLHGDVQISNDKLNEIALNCTKKDNRAKLATRSEEKRLKTQYAAQYLGVRNKAVVTGGIGSLLFVSVDDLMIEGGLALPREWSWNEQLFQMENNQNNEVIKIGHLLDVLIAEADQKHWQIKFAPVIPSIEYDHS